MHFARLTSCVICGQSVDHWSQ